MTAELNPRQSVFQWLFSLSWDWTILDACADRIAAKAFGLCASQRLSKEERRTSQPTYLFGNARVLRRAAGLASFKDRFLECAFLLAHELGLQYHDIGRLFDRTVMTGTMHAQPASTINSDVEQGSPNLYASLRRVERPVKEGGMMLLVREVTGVGNDTTQSFIDKGFRFSEIRFLAPILADKLGMDRNETIGLLKELKSYAKRGGKPIVQPGGCYVGVFAVSQSRRLQGGLDALVYGFARHQSPAYRLPDIRSASPAAKEWLSGMIGQTMDTVRQSAFDEAISYHEVLQLNQPPEYNNNDQAAQRNDPDLERKAELAAFQTAMYVAIDAMLTAVRVIPDMANRSHLSSEILDMPSTLDDSADAAQMILFHTVVPPSDQFTPANHFVPEYGASYSCVPTFVFTPYTLFTRAQSALLRGKFSKDFAREVRLELYKRYPNAATSPSVLDEIFNSPLVAKKGRRGSMVKMSPVLDRAKTLTKAWAEREKDGLGGGWREKHEFEKVELVALESPVVLRINKRQSALTIASEARPASFLGTDDVQNAPSDDSVRTPPNQSGPLVAQHNADLASAGSTPHVSVTPPPAFPASARIREAEANARSTLRRPNASDSISRALLAATGDTFASPSSLPAYRSPGSSPPPLVPLPILPAASASPDSAGKIRKSRRSFASKGTEGVPSLMRPAASVVKPLAQAARLRSDCWYERTMGEIQHSENARELYGVILNQYY